MKLKKIASLAMAGVLAVSMLAGCGDNASSSSENTKPTTTPAIVAAINDAQADNDAQVTLTYDSKLESTLTKAIDVLGNNAAVANSQYAIFNQMVKLTGDEYGIDSDLMTAAQHPEYYGNPADGASNPYDGWNSVTSTYDNVMPDKDGTKVTLLHVYTFTSQDAPTEEAALKKAASLVDDDLEDLADRSENVPSGKKYYDYTYTGTVAMTTVTLDNGTTAYFVAGTLTQAVAEK